MKIIALYLPQFHTIPENDKWWGKGFTEWTNVKNAIPYFDGHKQPKIPLDNNYYNLLDDNVKIWQAKLAREYGIYGFCYYHYWYNGHMLLEKPMEQMLKNPAIDIPFCIWWCNQPWTKSWVGNDREILIEQKIGDHEEWINHYKYLSQFFKDKRYIYKDNKPIVGIYMPSLFDDLDEMFDCWEKMSKEDGFDGLTKICTSKQESINFKNADLFDYVLEWPMSRGLSCNKKICEHFKNNVRNVIDSISKILRIDITGEIIKIKNSFKTYRKILKWDYDDIWNRIIEAKPIATNAIPSAFVNWDNTARYGKKGSICINATSQKFKKYLTKQIIHTKNDYKQDILFLSAWNEWAEWSVLEPEKEYGYEYLDAVREALIDTNEFPI